MTDLPTAFSSPLSLFTEDPELTELLEYLERTSKAILERPQETHVLEFSRDKLNRVREAFARTIRQGEAKLHSLSRLLAAQVFGPQFTISSSVVGKLPGKGERFTLTHPITVNELLSSTDLDLGNRVLEDLRFRTGAGWRQAELVANFVLYEGRQSNVYEVFKVSSRIKAEQTIWNKVADHIFDFDQLVQADKQLRHLSPFVKDVFGIKFVTSHEASALALQAHLTRLRFQADALREVAAPDVQETRKLEFLEVKDYLHDSAPKQSGWKAIKSVVRWWDQTFEVQIQPLANFFREQERFTKESHQGFKARREQLRETVAQSVPLFGFYHRLLKWLFLHPDEPAPTFAGIELHLRE